MKRILRPHLQHCLDYLQSIPDYEDFFNGNPNAAYTILALAASLALIGNFQIPKTKGLHYLFASQYLSTILLIFMAFKEIVYSPTKLICSCASVTGLSVMTFFPSTDHFEKSAEVAGFSTIFAWSLIPVLSFPQDTEGASRNQLEAYLTGSVFTALIIFAIAFLQVAGSADVKAKLNQYLSTRIAANVVIFNTVLLVFSQLG